MSARRIRNDIKSKRVTTEQLEQESKAMEKRLMELKAAMQKEREERELKDGAYWSAGQKKSLFFYKPEFKDTISLSKTMKVKILKDEEIVVNKRSNAPGTFGYLASQDPKKLQIMSTKSGNLDNESYRRGEAIPCGQCEEKHAVVHCQECCEDFCARCFAAFHLKGALKKHRSMPVSGFTPRVLSRGPSEEVAAGSLRQFLIFDSEDQENKKTSSLLDDTEPMEHTAHTHSVSISAHTANATQQTVRRAKETTSHSTETVGGGHVSLKPPISKSIEIVFQSSLTYAEKLLLKKHRREDLPTLTSATTISEGGDSINTKSPRPHDLTSFERIRTIIRDSENNIVEQNDHSYQMVTPRPLTIEPLYAENEDISAPCADENTSSRMNKEESPPTPPMNEEDNDQSPQCKPMKSARKSRGSTAQLRSARKSARVTSQKTPREKIPGGYLAQLPCDSLKNMLLQSDQVNSVATIPLPESGPDEAWLMFGVAGNELIHKEKTLSPKTPLATPRQSSAKDRQRVSYKLYSVTPRSWKPTEALASNVQASHEPHPSNPDESQSNAEFNNAVELASATNTEYLEELAKIDQFCRSNNVSRQSSRKLEKDASLRLQVPRGNTLDLSGGEYDDELESARQLEQDIHQSAITYGLLDMSEYRDSLELAVEEELRETVDHLDNEIGSESDDLDVLLSTRFQDSLDVEQLPQ